PIFTAPGGGSDVAATARFGDAQRADQFAVQGGSHIPFDLVGISTGGDMGHRDAVREQGGHEPGGGAGDDGGFGHDGNVDDVAALAADILAKPDPQQSGFGGLAVEPERHVPGGFPF